MPVRSMPPHRRFLPLWLLPLGIAISVAMLCWGQGPAPLSCQRATNGETNLIMTAPVGEYQKFEMSHDMNTWVPLHTGLSNGSVSYLDTGSPYLPRRFYRSVTVTGTPVTGDHIQTNDGVVTIKPLYHGSFYLHWARTSGNTIIYSDPSSDANAPAGRFTGLPKADLVLVTHRHGDHLNTATLDLIRNGTTTKIVTSQDAYNGMGTNTLGTTLKSMTTIFKTGQTNPVDNSPALSLLGVTIEGVAAYNTLNTPHVKGNCNSYILTIGGKRFFIAGDTGPVEAAALTNIDVAFLCINIPFTMTVAEAVTQTRTFKPKIVYPYHLRNQTGTYSDVGLFKTNVGADLGIEVRNRNWY